MNLNIRRLSLSSAHWLMNQYFTVGQGKPFPFRTGSKEKCAHGCCHPDTNGGYIAFNVLHGIINGQPGRNGSPRAVDIQPDVLVRIGRLQIKKLCDDQIG